MSIVLPGISRSFARDIPPSVYTQESILSVFKGAETFTSVIEGKIMIYKGWSEKDLDTKFEEKGEWKNNILIRKILGLTGDVEKTKEFQKANMNIRVTRVKSTYIPKEDSPFKTYNFMELVVNDVWGDSHPYR